MSKASRERERIRNEKLGRINYHWSKALLSCIKHFSGHNSIEELKADTNYINNPMFKVWIHVGTIAAQGVMSIGENAKTWHISQEEMIKLQNYLY